MAIENSRRERRWKGNIDSVCAKILSLDHQTELKENVFDKKQLIGQTKTD